MTGFEKRLIKLRGYFEGAKMFRALKALDEAILYHCHTRKDGITHEFSHQVAIVLSLTTMEANFQDPERIYLAAIFHDTFEDYWHKIDHSKFKDNYGIDTYHDCITLSKIRPIATGEMVKLTNEQYYAEMSASNVLPIVKGEDRFHNLSSAVGVLTIQKIRDYVVETRDFVEPMLKKARKQCPHQAPVLYNITNRIKVLCHTLEHVEDTLKDTKNCKNSIKRHS